MPPERHAPLLHDLLDYLAPQSRWRSIWRRRARRAELVERLRERLAAPHGRFQFPDVVEATRRAWVDDARIRIEADAVISADRDGLWVAAWLLAGRATASISPEHLTAVLAGLPPLTRQVFTLHRHDNLDEAAIAAQLGMSADAVHRELVAALVMLDEALQVHRR